MKIQAKKRIMLYSVIAASALFAVLAGKLSPSLHTDVISDCFDTASEITVYSKTNLPIENCKKYMYEMNDELSAENPESRLYRYNMGENVEFSEDALELIDFSKKFTDENPDYFSVYLNPVIQLWDIKNNTGKIPDISNAMDKVKNKNELNLGATAKGYVTDKIVEMLKSDNIPSALINLGGNTYALGKKPDGGSWKIGIQDPKNSDEIIGVISAENLAVVTSGDYRRYFDVDNVRYHHIIDPKTGYPSDSGLHSATIISENAALADALSTAVFVAGVDDGAKLLKKYNVLGILITDDTVYFSKELENIFKQDTFTYRYEFLY